MCSKSQICAFLTFSSLYHKSSLVLVSIFDFPWNSFSDPHLAVRSLPMALSADDNDCALFRQETGLSVTVPSTAYHLQLNAVNLSGFQGYLYTAIGAWSIFLAESGCVILYGLPSY